MFRSVECSSAHKVDDGTTVDEELTELPNSFQLSSDAYINVEKLEIKTEELCVSLDYGSARHFSGKIDYVVVKENESGNMLDESLTFGENSIERVLDTAKEREELPQTLHESVNEDYRQYSPQKNARKSGTKAHEGANMFECNFCGKEFLRQGAFDIHVKAHSKNLMFICGKCGEKFSVELEFENHVKNHLISKSKCSFCNQIFPNKSRLKYHLQQHLEKTTFSCSFCNKVYTKRASFDYHMKSHNRTTCYLCEFCGKTYSILSPFRVHLKAHSGEKRFHCKDCGKDFFEKYTLEEHIRIHTNEKPFSCEKCKVSYRRKRELKVHLRTHTGHRPYQCKLCGRAFNQPRVLKVHERIHSGEKPFKCHECGIAFRQQTNLAKHVKTYGH